MSQEIRLLRKRGPITEKEITNFVFQHDTDDLNSCLIFNGGTGIGKTKQTMTSVKKALTIKNGKSPKMLVVQSRSATVEQINEQYRKEIESIGGIEVVQRIAFMNMIENGGVDHFDWVVIDECHGLFSEASFAEDASYIANWIRCGRTKQHIIFITANDEYFTTIFKDYFSVEYTYSQLFDNMKEYNSATRVKSASYIITTSFASRLNMLFNRLKGKRGIVFFRRASSVLKWYVELLKAGHKVFPIVSLGNKTPVVLSTQQQQILKEKQIDFSEGEAGLTMADLEHALDAFREANGLKGVRSSIMRKAAIPEDVNILLATDTLQEGVSICSHIDYIIIEGYTEVEVRQKLGRYRNDLEELYVVLNPKTVHNELEEDTRMFQQVRELQEKGNQLELAKLYGQLQGLKWKKHYIAEQKINGELYYSVNEEAYQHFLKTREKYLSAASKENYMYNLLTPYVANPQKDIIYLDNGALNLFNFQESINSIVTKWAGIPLKGKAQEEFIEDFESYGITDARGRPIETFTRCLNLLKKSNVQIGEKQANKKEIEKYPNYLTKVREKYKYIIV